MAGTYINIPKSKFLGSCACPDPTTVPRDEVSRFYTLLEKAVAKCTNANVQDCTVWISTNVMHSPRRMDALAKYLAELSTRHDANMAKPEDDHSSSTAPTAARKSISLLYVIHDVFHHAKHHVTKSLKTGISDKRAALFDGAHEQILPHITTIIEHAGRYAGLHDKRSFPRIAKLLDIWAREGYFNDGDIAKLRNSVGFNESTRANDTKNRQGDSVQQSKSNGTNSIKQGSDKPTIDEPAPIMIPAMHGDPNTPYYDLPAACMIPHIVPGRPINTALIKPLQFTPGPASPEIANAVRDLLQYANDLYDDKPTIVNGKIGLVIDPETNRITNQVGLGPDTDVDMLGQRLVRNKDSGEMEPVENYYGWSIEFCRKMQEKKEASKEARDLEDTHMRDSSEERNESTWTDESGPGMGFGIGMGGTMGNSLGMGMRASMEMGAPGPNIPMRRGYGRGGRSSFGGSRAGHSGFPY